MGITAKKKTKINICRDKELKQDERERERGSYNARRPVLPVGSHRNLNEGVTVGLF